LGEKRSIAKSKNSHLRNRSIRMGTAADLAKQVPLDRRPAWTELEVHARELRKQHLRTPKQVEAEGTPDWLVPHRMLKGNRRSNIIIVAEQLTAALGKLVALYEPSVFTEGAIRGIDSFDQWGVEFRNLRVRKSPAWTTIARLAA
jgi:glucose-6-phosphate isomerase